MTTPIGGVSSLPSEEKHCLTPTKLSLRLEGLGVEQVYRLGRRWTEKISSMNQSPP